MVFSLWQYGNQHPQLIEGLAKKGKTQPPIAEAITPFSKGDFF